MTVHARALSSMAQTRYRRPYNVWLYLCVLCTLCTAFLVLVFSVGQVWYSWLVFFAMLLVGILATIFDPEALQHTGYLEDGTPVQIKRPIIGLKKYETHFGVTGDYEVSSDGFRYEKAIWVLHLHPFSLVASGETVVWRSWTFGG